MHTAKHDPMTASKLQAQIATASGNSTASITIPKNLDAQPNDNWVFRTLAMGGWDYEANPILVVTTLELVKDENTGKMIGSNVIFDFVDPRKPSQRVAVMTKSLIEVLDQIKAAYTMEALASEGKR
jgi:hypothetical protein